MTSNDINLSAEQAVSLGDDTLERLGGNQTKKAEPDRQNVTDAEAVHVLNQVLVDYAQQLGVPTGPVDTEEVLMAIDALQRQRDQAQAEAVRLRLALKELVRLNQNPPEESQRPRVAALAWQMARDVLASTAAAEAPFESEALVGWTELHVSQGALYGSHPEWKSMMCIAAPVQVCSPSERLVTVDQLQKIMGQVNALEVELKTSDVDLSAIWVSVAELLNPKAALISNEGEADA